MLATERVGLESMGLGERGWTQKGIECEGPVLQTEEQADPETGSGPGEPRDGKWVEVPRAGQGQRQAGGGLLPGCPMFMVCESYF